MVCDTILTCDAVYATRVVSTDDTVGMRKILCYSFSIQEFQKVLYSKLLLYKGVSQNLYCDWFCLPRPD